MRKKIVAAMFVAVVAVVGSYNVYQSQNTNALSDLALANVEALASGEWGDSNCHMNTITWQCVPWGSGDYCYCWL